MLVNTYALSRSVMKRIRESISDVFDVRVEIIYEGNSVESYTSIDGF